jgi:glycosyltransferase involved in cell wall biosynthesis
LVKLILSPALRDQLGRAGRAHVVGNYSWEASLHIMLGVYQNVIDQHKKRISFTQMKN